MNGRSAPRWDYRDDHAELIAREREEDALRGAWDGCTCYSVEYMEFDPAGPCDHCRSRELAAIDRDGYDDKAEIPGRVA